MDHPISDLFQISLSSIREMIDVNTIVGESLKVNENVAIIPISRVKCAFATGGCDQKNVRYSEDKQYPFGGATGGTLTLTPIAFLVVANDDVKLLHLDEEIHLYEKLIDLLPEALTHVKNVFSKTPKVTNLEVIERKQPNA